MDQLIHVQYLRELLQRVSGSRRSVLTLHPQAERVKEEGYESLLLVNASFGVIDGRSPLQRHQESGIANSVYLDIDELADQDSELAHTAPLPYQFSQWCHQHGVDENTLIVAYSDDRTFTACRVLWMFRLLGHKRVRVLDGGLGAWQEFVERNPVDCPQIIEHPVGEHAAHSSGESNSDWCFAINYVVSADWMQRNIDTGRAQVVDARSAERFQGLSGSAGPRSGEPGGHIPGSRNIPYTMLLDAHGRFLPVPQLQAIFAESGVDITQPIVCTCGSGVTACVLFVALQQIGAHDVAVFDGSWQEWIKDGHRPIAQS